MTTIYTFNNKVLKNSANDKWLIKKEAPAGFVMNGSNATIPANTNFIYWESPTYPSAYNGNGKTAIVTILAPLTNRTNLPLFYAQSASFGGPTALTIPQNPEVGSYTFTLADNIGIGDGYGKYFVLGFNEIASRDADVSKIEIRIVNP